MIDKNIPIPKRPGVGALLTAVLPDMQIGDSFVCPVTTNLASTRAHISAKKAKLAPDISLVTRPEQHEGKTILRVWRTK